MKSYLNKKLILASSSPRRKMILEENGYEPVVIPSFGEMDIVGKEYSRKLVCECAKEKALESYEKYKNANKDFDSLKENMILVTADTVVVNEGIIYGKPKDKSDAIRMLKLLSGKTHIVCTAICVASYIDDDMNIVSEQMLENGACDERISKIVQIDKIVFITASEETKVTFRDLTDEEIENYIDASKPFDKAGAYGIQDKGFSFVKNIDGNLDNVIGFPIKKFEELIKQYNLKLK